MLYERLVAAASDAMLSMQSEGATASSGDRRSYLCTAPGCGRQGYAGGFCNAHYIRTRMGRPLQGAIRSRKRDARCVVCSEPTGGKGGWGRCSKHHKAARRQLLKQALVNEMGGCCVRCRGEFPLAVYDFHHPGNKEASIGEMFDCASLEAICAEAAQCELLCANCHRVEHADGL